MTKLAEFLVACAVMVCGEADEPPPAMRDIVDNIYDKAERVSSGQAPYIDEQTAKYERRLNDMEREIKRLESENKTLRSSVNGSDVSTVADDSEPRKVRDEPRTVQAATNVGNYEATFYTARCEGCSGITATGIDVRQTIYNGGKRIIAVDPNIIPLGSHVRVTLADGTSFEAMAQDVGGAIKGNRIDILVASRDEAYRLGRQSVKVEILK